MSQPQKRIKLDINQGENSFPRPNFEVILEQILQSNRGIEDHPFIPLLRTLRSSKHPILQVIHPQNEVFKSNPQKKKKPIEFYLDAVNHLYKKRDLDILINPVTPNFVFQKWSPRQVVIFEEGILKFGKQFQFIAELIGSKNVKDNGNRRVTINHIAAPFQQVTATIQRTMFDSVSQSTNIILHLLHMTQFAFVSFAILATVALAVVQQSPIIGIYTQIDEYDEPSTKDMLSTYISAAYVKYIEMSGAQVVPIFAFSNSSEIEVMLRKVNGILFTGGAGEDQISIDNRWVKNANFILQFAVNQNKNGRIYPIWGTCLGLELLSYLTSGFDENILQPITGADHMLNILKFQQISYLYDDLDSNLKAKLTSGDGILYFNHQDGLKQSSFKNSKLMMNFWKATSTTRSRGGDIYISTLESNEYPIFAVQFHPEKNLFQWRVSADRTDAGALISQILSNKFVQFARQNTNRFENMDELRKILIYNYKTTTTNLSYLRIYPFKEPRPDDWPYSLRHD